MKTVKLVTIVIICLVLVLVVVQNTAPMEARFLWLTATTPAILLLFITAVGGFVLGMIVALLVARGAKPKQTRE